MSGTGEIPKMGRRWKDAIPALDLSKWLCPSVPGEPTDWKLYRLRANQFNEFIQTIPGDPIRLEDALEKFLQHLTQDSRIPPIVKRGRGKAARAHVRDESQPRQARPGPRDLRQDPRDDADGEG